MPKGKFLDSERIAKLAANGMSPAEIATKLNLKRVSVNQSLRRHKQDVYIGDEQNIRARWAEIIGPMRERLRNFILNDNR